MVGVSGSWRRLRRWLHAQGRSAGSGGEWRVSSAGIEGSCGLLHVGDEMGGGGEWPHVCVAEWWCGATVGSVL